MGKIPLDGLRDSLVSRFLSSDPRFWVCDQSSVCNRLVPAVFDLKHKNPPQDSNWDTEALLGVFIQEDTGGYSVSSLLRAQLSNFVLALRHIEQQAGHSQPEWEDVKSPFPNGNTLNDENSPEIAAWKALGYMVTLMDIVFDVTEKYFWANGIVHCDLHLGNIHVVPGVAGLTGDEFKRYSEGGAVMRVGDLRFVVLPQNLRFIDFSHSYNYSDKPFTHPKASELPCTFKGRLEDVAELPKNLYRTILSDNLFSGDPTTLAPQTRNFLKLIHQLAELPLVLRQFLKCTPHIYEWYNKYNADLRSIMLEKQRRGSCDLESHVAASREYRQELGKMTEHFFPPNLRPYLQPL